MGYAGIRLVGDDQVAVARLCGLLNFVGEPVKDDIDDVVMLVADGQGRWPHLTSRPHALVLVGEGQPPEAACVLGHLREPVDLAALLDCLHRVHAFRRDRRRRCGAGAIFFGSVVGISDGIARVRALMAEACARDTAVLVRGEPGTGKEVVARALHEASPRRRGPFVSVDCGSMAPERVEMELFGYERGACPGGVISKAGRFELASRGTLFLDGVAELPLAIQARVLRVIREQITERAGSAAPRHVDVRIIAATHRDLELMVEEGVFREDLYHCLSVMPVRVPALRDRPEDIEPLTYAITGRLVTEQGRCVRLAPDAMALLKRYPWPGNVRELKNLLERLAVEFADQVISAAELPGRFHDAAPEEAGGVWWPRTGPRALLPVEGLDLKDYLGRLERTLIEQALADANSVVARAADRLQIRRTTLVEKMRKYGIERP